MIGFAVCGSFCTHSTMLKILRELVLDYDVCPILSEAAYTTDTRFGNASDLIESVEDICRHKIISTVKQAEVLGPKMPLDSLIVCPCTGNTLAKSANGITDSSVTMAIKAHLRSNRNTLICLASNDATSVNLKNIGIMINRKNVYFSPMRQDDPVSKPHSLVFDETKVLDAFDKMNKGIQAEPVFLT